MHHVLEHLGQQTEIYLKIIQELYRIYKPRAKVHITVPHHRSDRFFHDPTHVCPITPVGLSTFSKRLNREWQAKGKAFTVLALYVDVDFEVLNIAIAHLPLLQLHLYRSVINVLKTQVKKVPAYFLRSDNK